jgi:NADPH:quinone reductase-like Zn-dependent oxidoreductase
VTDEPVPPPATMRAIRLKDEGLDGLVSEQIPTPEPGAGEALVRVHAAAITRDELDWPTDRLPAIPSPLAALSAWQALFDHGVLAEGQRVLIHGATGGVGRLATQLARERGAHVIVVVEPNREQLLEISTQIDAGGLRPAIDGVFELSDARAAFERSLSRDTRGKVVLRVAEEEE